MPPLRSSLLKTRFAEYAAFHATPGNQVCHAVGIPLIVLTLFTLLGSVPLFGLGGFEVTLAELALAAVLLHYLTLDAGLAALMLAAFVALDALGRQLPLPVALLLFVLGWALQFAGHYVYEKKSPAFFRNFAHLLVGPLWIAAKAVGRA